MLRDIRMDYPESRDYHTQSKDYDALHESSLSVA